VLELAVEKITFVEQADQPGLKDPTPRYDANVTWDNKRLFEEYRLFLGKENAKSTRQCTY
jgi:hypothetical protein